MMLEPERAFKEEMMVGDVWSSFWGRTCGCLLVLKAIGLVVFLTGAVLVFGLALGAYLYHYEGM